MNQLEDSEGKQDLTKLLVLLDQYGIKDWVELDSSIIREYAYYTGIVFEAFDRQKQQSRAICGGGRYNDMLLPMFIIHGEYPTCAVGFGMSDVALEELLNRKGLMREFNNQYKIDVLMSCTDEKNREAMYQSANELRSKNISVVVHDRTSLPTNDYNLLFKVVIDFDTNVTIESIVEKLKSLR